MGLKIPENEDHTFPSGPPRQPYRRLLGAFRFDQCPIRAYVAAHQNYAFEEVWKSRKFWIFRIFSQLFVKGEMLSKSMDAAPALCPKAVTLFGSPPKIEIFS